MTSNQHNYTRERDLEHRTPSTVLYLAPRCSVFYLYLSFFSYLAPRHTLWTQQAASTCIEIPPLIVFPNFPAYPVRFPVNPRMTHAGQTVVEEAGCRMGGES